MKDDALKFLLELREGSMINNKNGLFEVKKITDKSYMEEHEVVAYHNDKLNISLPDVGGFYPSIMDRKMTLHYPNSIIHYNKNNKKEEE